MEATTRNAAGGSRRGRGAKAAGPQRCVEGLRQRFAAFRRRHPSRTRIPDSLRDLALATIEGGTSTAEVRRACGVTSDQLAQWRMRQNQREQARVGDGVEAPLVFPVVDGAGSLGMGPATEVMQDLELRLGGWSICIRQVEG